MGARSSSRGRTQTVPSSAHGARNEMRASHGTFHVSCNSSRPPRQIIQEVVRTLTSHRINFRHVSSYLVRCQTSGVRFEAEVLQLDHCNGYMLRFSRAGGDTWQYKE